MALKQNITKAYFMAWFITLTIAYSCSGNSNRKGFVDHWFDSDIDSTVVTVVVVEIVQ
jgi:hypothetical protein